MTTGSLIKVENIADCSFLQYFWPALSDNRSWKPILVLYLSGRLRHFLLCIFHYLHECQQLNFCTAKAMISLDNTTVRSKSLLCTLVSLRTIWFLCTHSECKCTGLYDSLLGEHIIMLVLSCSGPTTQHSTWTLCRLETPKRVIFVISALAQLPLRSSARAW